MVNNLIQKVLEKVSDMSGVSVG